MGHYKKQQITIFPTTRCNMQCSYCVASKSRAGVVSDIDLEFAKAGIRDYFEDGRKHQIRFYSNGEPTCALDIIKECCLYAYSLIKQRNNNDKLISEIQTNCYFNDDTARWIGENINYVWASIDGWPELNDECRKSTKDPRASYKIIDAIKLIKSIKEEKEDSFIGVRITATNYNVDKQVELVQYFNNLGIKDICIEPCFMPVDFIRTEKSITLIDIKKYAEGFIKAWEEAQKLGVKLINSFIVNFDEKVEYACRACLPTPHLTVDGYVSSCDLGFSGETLLKDLIYGEYNKQSGLIEYSKEAIDKLRKRKCEFMQSCNNCEIKAYCGGGCLGRSYHETDDFFGTIPDYCWLIKYFYKSIFQNDFNIEHLHP